MPSESTLYNYRSILNRLEDAGFDAEKFATNPKETIEWVDEFISPSKSIGTISNTYCAICWKLKEEYPLADLEPYKKRLSELRPKREAQQKSQDLPQEKKDNLLPWTDIVALDEKAKSLMNDTQYLIYCLYTKQPPVRADYDNLHIVSRIPKDTSKNYVVVSKSKVKFVFNQYKTAKTYGQAVLEVSPQLAQQIRDYIKKKDRKTTLFEGEIASANALTKEVLKIFKALTNKNLGISLLRHSYITEFYKKQRSIKEKEEISKKMLHSYVMQEMYCMIDDD